MYTVDSRNIYEEVKCSTHVRNEGREERVRKEDRIERKRERVRERKFDRQTEKKWVK